MSTPDSGRLRPPAGCATYSRGTHAGRSDFGSGCVSLRLSYQKYGATRTEIDGHIFSSRAEASRYAELRLLERAGQIADLRLQPRFVLQPAFVDNKGRRQPAVRYTADFAYREPMNPREVVEEVKGVMDKSAAIRIRLFIFQHQEVDFRIVQAHEHRG